MENATKALIMVAGVLIGVMILSLGSYLFYVLNGYVTTTQEQMELNANNQFNAKFLKYMTQDTQKLTIQDVVSVANLAYQNNKENDLLNQSGMNPATNYVQVNIKNTRTNIEKEIISKETEILNEGFDKTYICPSDNIIYSSVTGRIISITFEQI